MKGGIRGREGREWKGKRQRREKGKRFLWKNHPRSLAVSLTYCSFAHFRNRIFVTWNSLSPDAILLFGETFLWQTILPRFACLRALSPPLSCSPSSDGRKNGRKKIYTSHTHHYRRLHHHQRRSLPPQGPCCCCFCHEGWTLLPLDLYREEEEEEEDRWWRWFLTKPS